MAGKERQEIYRERQRNKREGNGEERKGKGSGGEIIRQGRKGKEDVKK